MYIYEDFLKYLETVFIFLIAMVLPKLVKSWGVQVH